MAKQDDELKTIAQRLCVGAGHIWNQKFQLEGGVEIPMWVTFVSRAEQLLKEREVFK